MKIALHEPVVVSPAPPEENRWGYWQFPYLFRLPSGDLMLTHHVAPDEEATYGRTEAPCFVSSDDGRVWRRLAPEVPEFARHPTHLVRFPDGECFFVPPSPPAPLSSLPKIEPVGALDCAGPVMLYDMNAAPEICRTMTLMRRMPGETAWRRETARLDLPRGLLWSRGDVIANSFIESKPIMARDGALIVADFRTAVRQADGSLPARRGVSVFASADRGRTWTLRAIVAYDRQLMFGEPFLAYAPDGELLCALRTTVAGKNSPLYLSRSPDDGHTWSAPEKIADVGVFPNLLTLGCGVTVLSYGRPGLWLAFSGDGHGRAWSNRITLVEGDPRNDYANTCGYSSLEALDDRRFLVAYSDFQWRDAGGRARKALLSRAVELHD